jgi:hypothetical protein
MNKNAILQEFVDKWSCLPEQRSPEWFAVRTHNIGASEMGTLLGINKYQNIKRLIEMHCGLVEFGDKTAVNWGCVLEEVITKMVEIIFQCKITEMGSIPTVGCIGQRCSPDGVAVVKMLGDLIVSFEFKAPKNRLPRGSIPEYYIPQVYSCLHAVEPADIGIFVDTVIRKCASVDWTFSNIKYDTEYHRKTKFFNVVGKSILYFCDTSNVDSPVNLGESQGSDLDKMLSDVAEHHKYTVKYGRVVMSDMKDTNIEKELNDEMPINCIAFLPVKIMQVDIIPVNKIPGYVFEFQPLITRILNVIKKITDSPEKERRGICDNECRKNHW